MTEKTQEHKKGVFVFSGSVDIYLQGICTTGQQYVTVRIITVKTALIQNTKKETQEDLENHMLSKANETVRRDEFGKKCDKKKLKKCSEL